MLAARPPSYWDYPDPESGAPPSSCCWVAIPPVEVEYCRVCTTFDEAYKTAQHRLEQSPSDA